MTNGKAEPVCKSANQEKIDQLEGRKDFFVVL